MSDCIPAKNKPGSEGYSARRIDGRRVLEHRYAWELAHGPIPAGMTIDHACHDPATCPTPGPRCPHRACTNVEHLRLMTRSENSGRATWAARTECPQGHPYDQANTYTWTSPTTGWAIRHCRECRREKDRVRVRVRVRVPAKDAA